MAYLEMVPRKEHVTQDWYVKPTELVHSHAQLGEALEMAPAGVLVMKGNCVKQMEHALQVGILNTFLQYHNYKCNHATRRKCHYFY